MHQNKPQVSSKHSFDVSIVQKSDKTTVQNQKCLIFALGFRYCKRMPPSPLFPKVLFGSPIELSLPVQPVPGTQEITSSTSSNGSPRNLKRPRPLPTTMELIPSELHDWWNQAMVKTRCARNWVSLDCYHSWYTLVCGGSWYQGLLELRKYNPWSVRERLWDGFWLQNSRDLNCEQN